MIPKQELLGVSLVFQEHDLYIEDGFSVHLRSLPHQPLVKKPDISSPAPPLCQLPQK